MEIVNKIISILKSKNISVYKINIVENSSSELFYILHNVDMARTTSTLDISVTVYKDFESEGIKMRGNAVALIFPDMTDSEIEAALDNAYYAAGFVKNKFYEIPTKEENTNIKYSDYDLESEVQMLSQAIFSPESKFNGSAYINSSEIFAYKSRIRIINSNGIDVSYTKYSFEGEFVAESKLNNQDVEIHTEFSYNTPEYTQLSQKVENSLKIVIDRASAINAPKAGKYDVLLTDTSAAAILSYYIDRASGAYIYAGYSSYCVDCNVQGENVIGENLNITLKAINPYSNEGIKMKNLPLTENGILKNIHCNSRFAYYLGVKPTGDYSAIECSNGTVSFESMKPGALQIAAFSDFQVDSLSGQFGGEIRLAYLYEETPDGIITVKLTGGSINGNIIEAGKDLLFSIEKYIDKSYAGPYAIKLKNISVAGS